MFTKLQQTIVDMNKAYVSWSTKLTWELPSLKVGWCQRFPNQEALLAPQSGTKKSAIIILLSASQLIHLS